MLPHGPASQTTTSAPGSRGSDWRRWDLHVHSPASVLNNQFGGDWDEYVRQLFSRAIESGVSVVGITDYFSIDGYKRIRNEYLDQPDRLADLFSPELALDPNYLAKVRDVVLLPNIELRIDKFVTSKKDGGARLTIHVIFSNEIPAEQIETNFLGVLTFPFSGQQNRGNELRPLNRANLEELGARLRSEHPKFSDRSNLFIGSMNATVSDDQVSEILSNSPSVFGNRHVLVLAEEYTSEINWDGADHQARKVLYQKCDAVFSSNEKTIRYWGSSQFAAEFGREKACFWGSDAHSLADLFRPAKARYCWIKSDTTFSGLRQVLNEPMSRCYIGEMPPSMEALQLRKKPYIGRLSYAKRSGATLGEKWFDGCTLHFNPGMVTIIGNKGSGKSALADTLALLGCSHIRKEYFAFLKPERFKKKYNPGRSDRSQDFEAAIEWHNGETAKRQLSQDVESNEVERVRYLPQGYLEKLCNESDDEARKAFQDELDRVIFSHVKLSDRLDKTSLQELIDHRTDGIQRTKSGIKRHVRDLNHQIVVLEQKTSASSVAALDANIRLKQEELDRFDEMRPADMQDPSVDAALKSRNEDVLAQIDLQKAASAKLAAEASRVENDLARLRVLIEEAERVREKMRKFRDYYVAVIPEIQNEMRSLGIDGGDAIEARVDMEGVEGFIAARRRDADLLEERRDVDRAEGLPQLQAATRRRIAELQAGLDGPLRRYQTYLSDLTAWEGRRAELIGEANTPDTLLYYIHQREEIRTAFPQKLEALRADRRASAAKVFQEIHRQAEIFRQYYQPALRFLKQGDDVLDSFAVSFDVVLDASPFVGDFFDFIAQNVTGPFCGVAEGQKKLREMLPKEIFDSEDSTIGAIEAIFAALEQAPRDGGGHPSQIEKQLRKNKKVEDFYNFLFCFEYLEPKYALRVGGKDLQELSPGERGLLLLVFYLLIDKDNCPLIIDQPEENLDNQSVKKVLVPCIRSAKERRQLFVVTHNPNVAVVCDSEQIIITSIDKKSDHAVTYECGSIEDGVVNRLVVDVLEGTPPAFENRSRKYRTGGSL